MEERRLGHSHIFVSSAVVEQVAFAALHHALDEYNIGHLAGLLPVFFWLEDGLIGSPKQFSWILAIKDRHAGAVDELVVSAVVNENDPPFSVRIGAGPGSATRESN